jgi:hypothetical protein
LFFDLSNFAIVKEYLGLDNLQRMKSNFYNLQEVKDLVSWFEGQPDLTQAEIEDSWQAFISDKSHSDEQRKEHRMAIFKAHFRGLGWWMNYFHEAQKDDDEISDEMLERIWKRINNW